MSSHPKHHTLQRQWETLKCLPRHGQGWATVREIVDALQASGYAVEARTVQRDLLELSELFPIELNDKGKPYGWRWMKGAHLSLPGMGVAEAVGLRLLEDYLSSLLPPSLLENLAGLFSQAQATLARTSDSNPTATWPAKVRAVPVAQPLLPPIVDTAAQNTLAVALQMGRQISAHYRAAGQEMAREYRLHPLALILRGPVLYLAARAFDYEDVRLYALHRFESAEMLDTAAVAPPGFDLDQAMVQGFAAFTEQGEAVHLILACEPDLAAMLAETPLGADQRMTSLPEGGAEVAVTLPDTWQLRWWLLSQGAMLEVLAPESLRQEMAVAVEAAATRYKHKGASKSLDSSGNPPIFHRSQK